MIVLICENCKSNLTATELDYNVSRCIYCGKKLPKQQTSSDKSMDDAIKEVVNHFGYSILQDNRKFIAVFVDFAPKLKVSKKVLSVALQAKSINDLISCPTSRRIEVIKRIIQELKPLLTDLEIQVVICALISAFDWETSYIRTLFLDPSANKPDNNGQRSPPLDKDKSMPEKTNRLYDVDRLFNRNKQRNKNYRKKAKIKKAIIAVVIVIIIVILLISLTIRLISSKQEKSTAVRGDLNGDGVVTNADLALLQDYIINTDSIPEEKREAADYDGDGKITSHDALQMKKDLKGE